METFSLIAENMNILANPDGNIFFNEENELFQENFDESDAGNPRKRRKKTSPVWLHFTETSIDGVSFAQCNYCFK